MQPKCSSEQNLPSSLGTSEFDRKFLTRLDAAIQAEQLEQIHN